jgi:hypothetical protein
VAGPKRPQGPREPEFWVPAVLAVPDVLYRNVSTFPGLLLLEHLGDAALGLLERHGAGGLALQELDDVVASLALHHRAQIVGLGQREGGLLEWGRSLAAADPREVAAPHLGARIVRVLGGQLREVLAALGALQEILGLGLGLLPVVGAGGRLDPNQDVAQVDPLRPLHLALVLLIKLAGGLVVHRDAGHDLSGDVLLDERLLAQVVLERLFVQALGSERLLEGGRVGELLPDRVELGLELLVGDRDALLGGVLEDQGLGDEALEDLLVERGIERRGLAPLAGLHDAHPHLIGLADQLVLLDVHAVDPGDDGGHLGGVGGRGRGGARQGAQLAGGRGRGGLAGLGRGRPGPGGPGGGGAAGLLGRSLLFTLGALGARHQAGQQEREGQRNDLGAGGAASGHDGSLFWRIGWGPHRGA